MPLDEELTDLEKAEKDKARMKKDLDEGVVFRVTLFAELNNARSEAVKWRTRAIELGFDAKSEPKFDWENP